MAASTDTSPASSSSSVADIADPASTGNLVINGDFDAITGSGGYSVSQGLSGWTESSNTSATPYGYGPGDGVEIAVTNGVTDAALQANGGSNTYVGTVTLDTANTTNPSATVSDAAFLVDDGAVETLSQTIQLVAGQAYQLGFDLNQAVPGAINPADFTLSAAINNTVIAKVSSAVSADGSTELPPGVWENFSEVFTAPITGANTVAFTYNSGTPGSAIFAKDVLLDNVSVTPIQPVAAAPIPPDNNPPAQTAPITVSAAPPPNPYLSQPDIVNLAGYTNAVTGGTNTGVGEDGGDPAIIGPVYGNATIIGTGNDQTITALGYANSILAGGVGDISTSGSGNGQVKIGDANHDAIVTGSAGNSSVVLGDGSDVVTLGGYQNNVTLGAGNNIIDAGAGDASVSTGDGNNQINVAGYSSVITAGDGDNSIKAGAGDATITYGTGTNSITAGGSSNVISVVGSVNTPSPSLTSGNNTLLLGGWNDDVTLASADNTVSGSLGGLTLTTGNGSQTISAGGYNNVITIGTDSSNTGDSIINAGLGSAVVKISGSGDNQITAAGYANSITAGSGDNTISAGDGNARVTVGDGVNTITVGGYGNVINIAGGSATVTLSASNNTINSGAGIVTVNGGSDNSFNLTAPGGTFNLGDFNAFSGNVLNLSSVIDPLVASLDVSARSLVSASYAPSGDLQISIGSGASAYVAADLKGVGGMSLDNLIASHSVVI